MAIDLWSYGVEEKTIFPSRPFLMHHSTQQQTIPNFFWSARIRIIGNGATVKRKTSQQLGLYKIGIKIDPYAYNLVCVCARVYVHG
jgi:hypothetical protein